tara:strand:+ start:535 stop:951 length:417 start_codon:yes stop_codon:yes gene_type:complete
MNILNRLEVLVLSGRLDFEFLSGVDCESLLDDRDSDPFDSKWVEEFKIVSDIFSSKYKTKEDEERIERIREIVFKMVSTITGGGEIASYISDDFELIAKAAFIDYDSSWVGALLESYMNFKIPQGQLDENSKSVSEII